jgi:hypothetical protein
MWGIPGAILSMPNAGDYQDHLRPCSAAGCAWPLSRGVKPSRFRRYISEFILHQFLHSLVLISGLSCKTTFNGRNWELPGCILPTTDQCCCQPAVTDFAIGNQRGCSGEISVDHRFRQCGARDLFRRAKIGRRSGVKFGCRGHAECKNIASERRGRRLAELLDPERTKLAARQSVEQIDADLLLTAWTHGPFPPWPCTLVSAALAFTNRLLRGSLAAPGCERHVESRAVMMTGGLPCTSRRMRSTSSAGRNISLTK